jgi:hypothetical protein
VLSTSTANRLRMLLAVLAGTIVICLAVLAVVLVVGAVTAGAPSADGGDWGGVY